jgi:Domain of unknown function (DUF1707)
VLGKALVMTGPQGRAVAGGDRLRAGHADREQVIEALKAAFVHGRLTKAEFDTRAGQALSARTYADLSVATADIPAAPLGPPASALARPASLARRRPLVTAAAGSSLCVAIAFGARWAVGHFDPGGVGPNPEHYLAPPFIFLGFLALLSALGILVAGVAASVNQRRSRRQSPPRPGPGGRALDAQRLGVTGHHALPPSRRTGKNRADLSAHQQRERRQRVSARAGRAPGGVTTVPGAA